MLWYKSWLETRWRFVIGLVLLTLSAAGTVLSYPEVVRLLPLVPQVDPGGEIGRRIAEAVELARSYRSYLWSQWFRQNVTQMFTLFAALLGTGGLLSQAASGGTLFTLSLPVSRSRLLGIRAATGLAELLVLAFLPSLTLPLLSPAIGQSYGVAQTLVHSACVFVVGSVLFSLAFLLSTVFSDVWRPLLITIGLAILAGLCEEFFRGMARYGLFGVMSAETYFRSGQLPWFALLAAAAASLAMIYAATVNIARQDF